MTLAGLAALALILGAGCFYVAAPHQTLITPPANSRTLRLVGLFGLAIALILLLLFMGPATAVFTWMVGMMLLWSIPPIVIRWLRFRRENAR